MTSLKVQWEIGLSRVFSCRAYKHICAYSCINTKNLYTLIFVLSNVSNGSPCLCHPLASNYMYAPLDKQTCFRNCENSNFHYHIWILNEKCTQVQTSLVLVQWFLRNKTLKKINWILIFLLLTCPHYPPPMRSLGTQISSVKKVLIFTT